MNSRDCKLGSNPDSSLLRNSPPKRLLIIRLSAIGDIVMASGMTHCLRQIWPDAKIDWLAEPMGASMLTGHEDLNRLLVLPRPHWKKLRQRGNYWQLAREFLRFYKILRQQQYDLILDLQGLLKSGVWALLARGETKIGLGSKEGSQWFFDKLVPRESTPVIASEYRHLAKLLGARPENFQMSIPRKKDATARVSQLLAHHKIKRYAVLCVFTTRPQKHWMEAHWQELAASIQLRFAIPCIVVGAPEDRNKAKKLCASTNMLSLAGATSLSETSALISGANFVVGVDTGVTHMGIMHRVPTLCLFGSTAPYLHAPGADVIYLNKTCAPCRRNPVCGGTFDCMSDITPEIVLNRLLLLLEKQSSEQKARKATQENYDEVS